MNTNDANFGLGRIIQEASRYRMLRDLYEAASDRIIAERMAQRDLGSPPAYHPQTNAAIEGDDL